jgi:hypothetical protein
MATVASIAFWITRKGREDGVRDARKEAEKQRIKEVKKKKEECEYLESSSGVESLESFDGVSQMCIGQLFVVLRKRNGE